MPTPLEISQAKRIEELEQENRDLRALVQKLEARIAVLEELLKDKGKPTPPGERPEAPPAQPRKRRKRRGRKPGFDGTSRMPPPEPDRIVDLKLDICPRCDTKLGQPCGCRNHIVEEMPIIVRLLAILYRHHRYWCPGCQCIVEAGLHPEEPKHGKLGMRALLFCADLKHRIGVPYRKISEILAAMGGIRISAGGIQQAMTRLSVFFTASYLGLIEALRKARAVYADETGWKMDGLRW